MVRHRFHKPLDGSLSASRCVAFKPLADQHDEHRFGGRKVFAHGHCGDDSDYYGEISGNLVCEEAADGAIEHAVAGNERQNRSRIDAEDCAEHASDIQQQQKADESGKRKCSNPIHMGVAEIGGRWDVMQLCS